MCWDPFLSSPFDKAFVFHIYSSSSPTGIQEEPLSFQKHRVPQVIGFHILQALARAISNAFTVTCHFLALDAHFPVNTDQTQHVLCPVVKLKFAFEIF